MLAGLAIFFGSFEYLYGHLLIVVHNEKQNEVVRTLQTYGSIMN